MSFVDSIASFLSTYYVDPIKFGTGYNIVNTVTYAIILIIAAVIVYKLIKKMNIKIDKYFLFSIVPFVLLGGILRSLEDLFESSGAARNALFITPMVYIVIFFIALAALIVSIAIQKKFKIKYYKSWFVIGIAIVISSLAYGRLDDANALGLMLGIFAAWIAGFIIVKFIASKWSPSLNKFLSGENMFILLVHLFDATTTFVALEFYPYFEQHVLTGFLINVFGTPAIFITKLVVVSVVLYAFDKELAKPSEIEKRTFLKVIVVILGLGPGLRNFLRLIMGV